MLTAAQHEARKGKFTASRAACLMTADERAILDLWREMTGDPTYEPEDLSGVWPVQLGAATEALNLEWFARRHGAVTRQGEVVVDVFVPWAAATLDGWSVEHDCPIECKHCGGREPLEQIIERYQPQMQWQMTVTCAAHCALSVIMGANEPIVEFIDRDRDYATELMRRAEQFMECVRTRTPPVALPPVAAPVTAAKIYQMQGNNAWASEAIVWLENKDAAKCAHAAEKSLKGLVPADAAKCTGHGIQITRNRAGSLSLREITQ